MSITSRQLENHYRAEGQSVKFRQRHQTLILYCFMLSVFGGFYAFTCAPTVLWQDSGLFQYRIWHNDIEGRMGLALAHPLYILIGMAVKYIPGGELAFKINLISAFSAAITVANLFLLLRLWLRETIPALVGAITLGISHTFWQQACIAEVYTLYTALFLTELVVLFQFIKSRRIEYLYLLGLLNGLSIANHMWGAIAFICYLVFIIRLKVRKEIVWGNMAFILLFWVIGNLPYEYLIVKGMVQSGEVGATISSAFFGNSWQGDVLNTNISGKIVKENIMFFILNFPTPNIMLFFVGLYCLKSHTSCRSLVNILLALLILFFGFAFRYQVPDRYVFFLPFYCLAAIMVGAGCSVIMRWNRKITILLILIFIYVPLPLYMAIPRWARNSPRWSQKLYPTVKPVREVPYRDKYKYFLQPWQRGYRGAERFAREVLQVLEENALIYADGTTVYPLLYVQEVQNTRPDVVIISNHTLINNLYRCDENTFDKFFQERPVYVVSPFKHYCPDFILERYTFKQVGHIWKVDIPIGYENSRQGQM